MSGGPERKILRRIFRRLGGEGQFIIQARNASGAALALQATADIRQARVVYDVRGAEPEELAQRLGEDCPADLDLRSSSHLLRQAYINEQIAFRGAAGCVFVSGALRDHLTSRYGAIQIPVSIQPCTTDVGHFQKASVERELVRRELGLSDRFVFCYVGSLEWYQKPELGLKWFEAIRKSVRDCHFSAITTQPEQFRQMGLALGVPTERLTCLRTGASGVARLTSAADIGLMLRDETIVNRVASPVKFAEYMASGLPVLITPGLGDYSYAVASRQLGIVVTGTPDCDKEIALCVDRIREIRAQRDQFSKRCCEFATTHLSWENSISSHSDFLQHVLESTR